MYLRLYAILVSSANANQAIVDQFFGWLQSQPPYVLAHISNMDTDIVSYHVAEGPAGWTHLRRVADTTEQAMQQQQMTRQINHGLHR